MKRKTSEQIRAISDCLQEIWSELKHEGDDDFLCISADHIEVAIDALDEARMELAGSGR